MKYKIVENNKVLKIKIDNMIYSKGDKIDRFNHYK